jgi:hypothetical protein
LPRCGKQNDAEPIRGYVSFYRSKISALYEGEVAAQAAILKMLT